MEQNNTFSFLVYALMPKLTEKMIKPTSPTAECQQAYTTLTPA